MHVPINVKSPNNISEWQMGFNSAFKGLISDSDSHSYGENYGSCKYRRIDDVVWVPY